ncbi:hypothetical protein OX89_13255 [Diaphorobacter sp. J5-51]|nr:hypothetical protein OX89_13255 [Diaphorobacter sp. J5-51]
MPTLHWVGKEKVVNHHHDVPFRLLDKQYSFAANEGTPASSTDNRIIHGDNLEALKSLLPEFEGRVNCIYIDPPYNTGNDIDKKTSWTYNDSVDDPRIRRWLGNTVGKEDLSKHDKWLCMMYPRLKLLHRLLHTHGVFLCSIDDNEVHRLRLVMDEIFGATNFIAQITWDKTRKNDAKLFSSGHEYVLVYAKNLAAIQAAKTVWREEKPGAREIIDEWKRLRLVHGDDFAQIEVRLGGWFKGLGKSHPSKKLSRYRHVDKFGPWRDRDISWPGGGGPRYDVMHPTTRLPCKVPERGWIYADPKEMQRQIDLDLVVFRADHNDPPIRKAHLIPSPAELDTFIAPEAEDAQEEGLDDEDGEELSGTQVMPTYIYKQAQASVKTLRAIFEGKKVFANPKDHEVIARLIRYVTPKNAIVLDSFGGSGSTAHATLAANLDDGGTRRFILCEMMDYAETITAERVRRVMNGYGEGAKAVPGTGGGFDFYTIGPCLFDEDQNLNEEVGEAAIRDYVAYTEGIRPEHRWGTDNPVSRYALGASDTAMWLFRYERGQVTSLDMDFLGSLNLKAHLAAGNTRPEQFIVYADKCALDADFLFKHGITFKRIPRDITKF